MLVCNHQSYLDPPLVGSRIGFRQVDYLARDTLFAGPLWSAFFRSVHCIPVSRGAADVGSLKECVRRLGMGRAVLVFPEGTRSEDGEVGSFKRGVSLLIKRAGCVVMPVAVEGAQEAWPKGSGPRLFRHRVTVRFGEAIGHAELVSGGGEAALARLEGAVRALRSEIRGGAQAR